MRVLASRKVRLAHFDFFARFFAFARSVLRKNLTTLELAKRKLAEYTNSQVTVMNSQKTFARFVMNSHKTFVRFVMNSQDLFACSSRSLRVLHLMKLARFVDLTRFTL
ncbi:hypothetical protein L6452_41683 [Arctium lappa]|uniref:Uncharacterized protein n=1 Tax=Arctium lappa TaxID=4217 RepID=A0ACB8XPC0_ARCLA|nr:hypothetical protein L6452_41683 [Arctium lappa]